MNIRVVKKAKEVKEFIEKKGFEFIGPYLKNNVKFKMKCKEHGEFERSWVSLIQSDYICQKCGFKASADKQSFDKKIIKEKIENKGYAVLDVHKYKNSKTKLTLFCTNGHKFKINMGNLHSGKGCPTCRTKEGKNEKECREIFERLLEGYEFKKIRPDFLINPKTGRKLELDGYCPELNLAFEYNGEYHYKESYRNTKRGSVSETKKRDTTKRYLCRKNGIRLITIPYNIKNKEKYIHNKLTKYDYIVYI